MAADVESILNSLKTSVHEMGILSFSDLLADLAPDSELTGGYAKRDQDRIQIEHQVFDSVFYAWFGFQCILVLGKSSCNLRSKFKNINPLLSDHY